MSTDSFEAAIASTRQVLANISASQLSDATPCAEWNVSQVINHVVGVQYYFTAALKGETPGGDAPDFASGDFLGSFDAGSKMCVEAFQTPGVLDQMIELPFGTMPGVAVLGIATSDTFTHGWDLAKATGQNTDLEPTLAQQLYAQAQGTISPTLRNHEGNPFGPEQSAPAGATAADQLAAFLGRRV